MIELSRHIESLMLKHDCVIVPGLGGFVTQYVPARRIDDERIFLPPHRSVGFNQQLTINDGLLVQSYMQAYDTNYPETIKLIEDAVRQLKDKLQSEGEYELSGIGCLTMGIGGQYNFIPCEAGVLSPELYGLDALSIERVTAPHKSAEDATPANSSKSKKVHVKRTERDYTISINRELANYAAAAVAAVFFYFLWATPVTNSTPADQQAASMVYEQIFSKQAPKPSVATPVTIPVAEVPVANEKETESPTEAKAQPAEKAEKKDPKPVAEAAAPLPQGKYTLVLASAITAKNAETFSENLRAEGLTETRPYKRGSMIRVIYGAYPSEKDAYTALQKLRKHKAFADAWILKTE